MTPADELLFLTNSELIRELELLSEIANQELAHQNGDEIMVILLLRGADGDLTHGEASEAVEAYKELGRSFG